MLIKANINGFREPFSTKLPVHASMPGGAISSDSWPAAWPEPPWCPWLGARRMQRPQGRVHDLAS